MKRCCKCKKNVDEKFFGKNSSNKDRLAKQCNNCRRKQRQKDKIINPFYVRDRCREHRLKNPDSELRSQLKNKYGFTLEEYKEKILAQNNSCIGCFKKFTKRSDGHVDHCHRTFIFRGILCRQCNLVLGYCNDNIDTLKNLIEYLSKQK